MALFHSAHALCLSKQTFSNTESNSMIKPFIWLKSYSSTAFSKQNEKKQNTPLHGLAWLKKWQKTFIYKNLYECWCPLTYCKCRVAVLNIIFYAFIRLAVNLHTCCFTFLHVSSHPINCMSLTSHSQVDEGFKFSFTFITTKMFWLQNVRAPSAYEN